MKLEDLKNQINNFSFKKQFLIFKYSDNDFLVNQYIDAIAKLLNADIIYADAVYQENNLFEEQDDDIHVVHVQSLEQTDINDNYIVVTKSISKELSKELSEYIVEFPKLVDWQIEDYVKSRLRKLNDNNLKELCTIAKYDIYRIENEINKLSIFNEDLVNSLYLKLKKEYNYSDLSDKSIFDFVNAIMKKDKEELSLLYNKMKVIDVEPAGLCTLLINKFRNIIDVRFNANASSTNLNLTQKQINAIRYSSTNFKNDELIKIYKLLVDIDYKLKSGLLDYDLIVDYILCNII